MKRLLTICAAAAIVLLIAGTAMADVVNLLQNPGFETSNFTGWTVGISSGWPTPGLYMGTGANSDYTGVGTQGQEIPDPSIVCGDIIMVHSGTYAAYATVNTDFDPRGRFFALSQTVSVNPSTTYEVGYLVGAGGQYGGGIGFYLGEALLVVYGETVTLSGPTVLYSGVWEHISGEFVTAPGETTATVTFITTASGYGTVGLSFDDFYVTPEPATICLLGLGALGLLKKRRA